MKVKGFEKITPVHQDIACVEVCSRGFQVARLLILRKGEGMDLRRLQ